MEDPDELVVVYGALGTDHKLHDLDPRNLDGLARDGFVGSQRQRLKRSQGEYHWNEAEQPNAGLISRQPAGVVNRGLQANECKPDQCIQAVKS